MIFQNPGWYILFISIPVAIILYMVGRHYWKRLRKNRNGGSALDRQVVGSPLRRYLRFLLFLGAMFFLITGLMRPRWGTRVGSETEMGIDIALVLDISRSMSVRDVMPSRLERTTAELTALLRELEGNRFSLILFAGAAFIQCPLTTDTGAIREFLESASPALIGLQGTNIEDGLEKAARSLKSRFKRNRIVVLVSDGESHEGDASALARSLYRDHSLRVFTIGVGTKEGANLTSESQSGKDIVSKLDEESLRELAREGGGEFYRIGNERFDTAKLASSINSIEKTGALMQRPDTLTDRYPLFLAVALFLCTLAIALPERRN
jgi:Ca-activated chloride channel family protein